MKRNVVMVDVLINPARVLAKEILENHDVIHVKSDSKHEFYNSSDYMFDKVIAYDGVDFENLVMQVSSFEPICVVAGSEWGVNLADKLSASLGFTANIIDEFDKRRNKFSMSEALKNAGMNHIPQLRTSNVNEGLNWLKNKNISRAVVKPVDSAGSDDVYITCNESQFELAFNNIIGKENILFSKNESVLVQEFIEGQEHVVNTVTLDGGVWLSDCWKVTKSLTSEGRNIYDYDDLLSASSEEVKICFDYILQVLDTLGVVIGPAHSELILNDNGPVLIETGARISGAANPQALRIAIGTDQTQMVQECYLDKSQLLKRQKMYTLNKNCRCVHMVVGKQEVLSHEKIIDKLESLESFSNVNFRIPNGLPISQTVDVMTCPGAFFLVHEDNKQIEKDYSEYRKWEKEHL
ncbi:TPA: ATP-grasp domain-containing protein [Vibrio vulnificus]|uniref:ATP-grasp domain-containing protein n=1 Tax=Vibrio vulnificus TaxID=672 RepID=UPI00165D3939|nr:ATP-grasp domain-containing protein [Vibrio vulnificus]EGR9007453.1 ATP-grasp domain-containing protein [Vibrio vulnificus]EHU9457118.1 ATP-grasp domain-containing protein [Vibrio vulnificus]ELV8657033.1 ATP-grasp domain-containing protein [Vibrio vulnificus]MCA3976682.1 ATP-grasp domain-containing protein [Vibrio vulnificus]MCA4003608.1 ATP-grasp domain-containing protein [Vibrio vulnificus]